VLFQNAIKATVKASRAVAQAVEEFFAGERGSLKFNIGGRTIGFTRHGLNQVINRGVRPYEILDALRNPVRVLPGRGGVTRYIGRWAEIRVNGAGEVVTAIRFKSPEAP
jgi:hypothetical protein